MAEAKATKAPAKGAGAPPKGGKTGGKGTKAPQGATDPSPKVVDGTPRLLTYYTKTVRPRLQQQLGLKNPMQIPTAAEPFFMNLGAAIEITPAMNLEDMKAGVAKAAKGA